MEKDVLSRMIEEREQNRERYLALVGFITSSAYTALPEEEQSRLDRQQFAMQEYLSVLNERIHNAEETATDFDPASLIGKVVATISGKCDGCCGEECVKVYAPGIGDLCLIDDPMRWRRIEDFKDDKPVTGTYLVHQLWPNLHRFVFVANYNATNDEWRPWTDIDVNGMPLDEFQRKQITHIMPLGVPVIEVNENTDIENVPE